MPMTVTIGSATIVALSDTEQAYSARDVYLNVDDAALEPYRPLLDAEGKVLLNFGCYVIRADGRTVLVDTGWGPGMQGQLMNDLAAAGIAPESVDIVTFTHLHGDHIGWNLVTEGGQPRPRFPRARYLVPEGDWKHYTAQPDPSVLFKEQMLPLADLGVMDLISGDHALTPSITSVSTPGHTPGHLSFAVLSGGERGFVLGDVLISLVDTDQPDWSSHFDTDPDLARRTRHTTLERLEGDGSLVAASHLPKPGLGRIVRRNGKRVWEPSSEQ
jgi:glyoxylase-like metal-dependent hydrolase (beta-lactamase superfamily II)